MNFRLTVTLVLLGLALLFLLQNIATVEVQFLFWSLSMPRAILLLLILLVGLAAGWILHGVYQHRRDPGVR